MSQLLTILLTSPSTRVLRRYSTCAREYRSHSYRKLIRTNLTVLLFLTKLSNDLQCVASISSYRNFISKELCINISISHDETQEACTAFGSPKFIDHLYTATMTQYDSTLASYGVGVSLPSGPVYYHSSNTAFHLLLALFPDMHCLPMIGP